MAYLHKTQIEDAFKNIKISWIPVNYMLPLLHVS